MPGFQAPRPGGGVGFCVCEDLSPSSPRGVVQVRLGRAGKLIGGLSSEKVRWEAAVKGLAAQKANLVGNMLLAAGAIAYVGPFTSKYRQAMLRAGHRQRSQGLYQAPMCSDIADTRAVHKDRGPKG